MKARAASLLSTVALMASVTPAMANVAKFRVLEAVVQPGGKNAKVKIGWDYKSGSYRSDSGKGVRFFLHTTEPLYRDGNKGAPVSGSVDMTNGSGIAKLTVALPPNAKPGTPLYLTGYWPKTNHKWGMGSDRPGGTFTLKAAGPSVKGGARILDVNRASASQLTGLPGVGPALAQRIVDHRSQQGPFASVGQLTAVKGISTSSLAGFKALLEAKPRKASPVAININTATAQQLATLPGLGPSKAQAIVNYRTRNKLSLTSVAQLTTLPGIKQGLARRISPYVTYQGTSQIALQNSALQGASRQRHRAQQPRLLPGARRFRVAPRPLLGRRHRR